MNYPFWFFALVGFSLFLTFFLRKIVFVLDATGRKPLCPQKRYCEKCICFQLDQEVVTSIIKHLSNKHFSVKKRDSGYVFFSSVFSPYPIRIEMREDKEIVRLVLSDAHCQTMISRHQMKKYSVKLERVAGDIKEARQEARQSLNSDIP